MEDALRKYFLVDDDQFHIEMMSQILRNSGIENITTFNSGVSCLEQIHENPFVVFLDHQMDEFSGYETLRKIKRYDPNVFVVMVSAQEEIKTAVDSLKHGAFDYIQKNDQLNLKIPEVIERINEVSHLFKKKKKSFFKPLSNLI